jgi:hypothetical protein
MAFNAAVVAQFQAPMELHGIQRHRYDRLALLMTLICLFFLCRGGTISARVDLETGILALAFGER